MASAPKDLPSRLWVRRRGQPGRLGIHCYARSLHTEPPSSLSDFSFLVKCVWPECWTSWKNPRIMFLESSPQIKKQKRHWRINTPTSLTKDGCLTLSPHGAELRLSTVVSELLMYSLLICFSPTGDFWKLLSTKLLIFESLSQNQLLEETYQLKS